MDTFIYLYFQWIVNVLFISFHHVVKISFAPPLLAQLHFLTREQTIACSGEREQMPAPVACAHRKIHPHAFLLNWRERSHSIQFNPSGKALWQSWLHLCSPKQLGATKGGWNSAPRGHERNRWKVRILADPELIWYYPSQLILLMWRELCIVFDSVRPPSHKD